MTPAPQLCQQWCQIDAVTGHVLDAATGVQSDVFSSAFGGYQAGSLAIRGRTKEANFKALSQIELNHLLDLEEEVYFASRSSQLQEPLGEKQAHLHEQGHGCAEQTQGLTPTEPTTLMVRNIACKLTAKWIRGQIDALGFGDAYDFFYLPLFRTGRSNQGYFFLNFKRAEDAKSFSEQLRGRPLGDSAKLCEICVAEWQGLAALHQQFDDRRVMKSACRPLFL
jgi:hypothetical protein